MNDGGIPPVIQWAQQQLALFGRIGCVDILRVPDPASSIPIGGANVAAPPLQATKDGTIIALYGQERAGTVAKFATLELRIQIGGQDDIITMGRLGGTFAPLLGLVGPNMNWFPLTRRFEVAVPWVVTYRNTDAGAVANPVTLFAFIADSDLPRLEDEYQRSTQ